VPVIHATFTAPLLASVSAAIATIAAATTAIRYAALAWDQWLYREES